jgi:hypothetical protein
MTKWIWPIRSGQTFFDVWSVVHLAFWLVVGGNLEALHQIGKLPALGLAYGCGFALSFGWEILERILELNGLVKIPEGKLNRWVSDPLMALIGMALGIFLVGKQ